MKRPLFVSSMLSSMISIFLFIVFFSYPASADDSQVERNSLKGLKKIHLLMRDFTDEEKNAGLSRSQMERLIIPRLTELGLEVNSGDVWFIKIEDPVLMVDIRGTYEEGGMYRLTSELGVMQDTCLKRDPSITVPAVTWSVKDQLNMERSQPKKEAFEQFTLAQVQKFIDAYKSVNGEERPTDK